MLLIFSVLPPCATRDKILLSKNYDDDDNNDDDDEDVLTFRSFHIEQSNMFITVKVWMSWAAWHSKILSSGAWCSLAALWPAFAHTLNMLAAQAALLTDTCE